MGEDLVSTIFSRIFQLEILDYPFKTFWFHRKFSGRSNENSLTMHLLAFSPKFPGLGVNGKHPTSSARFHGSYTRQVVFLLHGDTGT